MEWAPHIIQAVDGDGENGTRMLLEDTVTWLDSMRAALAGDASFELQSNGRRQYDTSVFIQSLRACALLRANSYMVKVL